MDDDLFGLRIKLPLFDNVRKQANKGADYMRRMGPFEPNRLPLDEMEYTTMPQVTKKLKDRFIDLRK